jgi:hypothetical protein
MDKGLFRRVFYSDIALVGLYLLRETGAGVVSIHTLANYPERLPLVIVPTTGSVSV